jgi:hypothetical protein
MKVIYQFDLKNFVKKKNIITFCLSAHFSYFIQSLNVDCFSVLKRSYDKELENFIKTHIKHIIKTEFFLVFKVAHFNTMITKNIKTDFRNIDLVSYDSQVVLFKLDIKLRTSTSIEFLLSQVNS